MSRSIKTESFSSADSPADGSSVLATIFVFGCWALLSIAAVGYVAWYGSPFPYYDDFFILDDYARRVDGSWSWLVRPVLGLHLIPLSRILTVGTWHVADGDMRPLLFVIAAMMSATALIMLLLLRRIQTGTRPDDVIVPLTLVGAHVWSSCLWAMVAAGAFGLPLGGCLTLWLVLYAMRPRPPHLLLMFLMATVIALQGGGGVLAAIGFVPAFAIVVLQTFSSPPGCSKWMRHAIGAACVLYLGVIAYMFMVQLSLSAGGSNHLRIAAIIRGFSAPSGTLALVLWPVGGLFTIGVLGSIAVSAWRNRRRLPLPGLVALATMIPGILHCGALATLRSHISPWHVLGVMPMWSAVYLASRWVMSPGGSTILVRSAILVATLSSGLGIPMALQEGRERREATRLLQADIAAGYPICRIAANNDFRWVKVNVSRFPDLLQSVAQLGQGEIARLRNSPALAFTSISTSPLSCAGCTENDGIWNLSDRARMYFSVGEPGVDAVRIVLVVEKEPWGSPIAVGPVDSQLPELGPALQSKLLYPDIIAGRGDKELTTTFVFPKPAKGFVLVPPSDRGAVKLVRIETGVFEPSPR